MINGIARSRALAGKYIVVTRPAHQAVALVEMLSLHGAHILAMPLIEICAPSDDGRALRSALGEIELFDWVVVTSANGAAAVSGALHNCVRRPNIAAVGSATNGALGSIADLVATSARGEVLAAEFPRGTGRVLIAQAEKTDGEVGIELRKRGWRVTEVAAYQTNFVVPDSRVLVCAQQADALVLASGSAARSWLQAVGMQTPPVVVAIGQTTAGVCNSVGIIVTAVAGEPTPACLIVTLQNIFSQPRP